MRGRLLPDAEVQALILQPGLAELVARLEATDYAPDLSLARARLAGTALVEEAVRLNLSRRLRDVRRFFSPSPSESRTRAARLVAVILGRYDIRNLLAIFRGRVSGLSWGETQQAILPAGDLDLDQLSLLFEQPTQGDIVRQLRRWSSPFVDGIADIVGVDDGSPAELDLALWHSFWHWALDECRRAKF
jgi:vacuolar-type H+-ATPase subunit C/Vma6